MLTENKSLKDSERKSLASYRTSSTDMSVTLSYIKTNKLITALYMVTDIVDKDEPLRNKLRTLGTEIISDIYSMPVDACGKINQVLSFLDIASAINIISEMNCNILRKEFSKLNQSILDNNSTLKNLSGPINLSEFFIKETQEKQYLEKKYLSIGHKISTRIGVQKGSTLMQALSDKTHFMSNNNFSILKKQRRDNITSIIKNKGGNLSIKDIKNQMNSHTNNIGVGVNTGVQESLICSEKTLQRELISMIKDNVLYKTGEKRWSRYFLK